MRLLLLALLITMSSARVHTDTGESVIADPVMAGVVPELDPEKPAPQPTTYAICNSPANPQWLIAWVYEARLSMDPYESSWDCNNQVAARAKYFGTGEWERATKLEENCNNQGLRVEDVRNLVNLRVNSFKSFATMRATYVLDVATGPASGAMSFFSKTADTTAWLSVVMQEPALVEGQDCFVDGSNAGLCQSSLFSLPASLWTSAHGFYCDSARTSCTFSDLSPADVVFAPSALVGASANKKRFLSTQLPQQNDYQWALITSGCSPPQFAFEVTWAYSPNYGEAPTSAAYSEQQRLASAGSRRLMGFGDQSCWHRTVTLVSISERQGFECVMPTSSNYIRSLASGTAAAVANIQGLKYARDSSADSPSSYVHMSAIQAAVLVACAAPTSFRKWSSWSTAGPGVCAACTSLRSTTQHMVAVACTAEQSRVSDCCFGCAAGYLSYRSSPTAEEPICVKACALGQTMAGGVCRQCEAGKFSYARGADPCKTCAELGYPNAFPGRFECVACGTRFQLEPVNARSCTACEGRQYVPAGRSVCEECGAGTVLSADGAGCTRCPPGTFHIASRGVCLTCPANYFMSGTGATACIRCPTGTRSAPGRVTCVPCPALDPASNTEYVPDVGGCDAVRCKTGFYSAGAARCLACSTLSVPNGAYQLADNCARTAPCTNAPANDPNAVYTGPAPPGGGAASCPWSCRDGTGTYRPPGSTSAPCANCVRPGFNASIHVWTTGCDYACARGRYSPPAAPLSTCQTLCADFSAPPQAWPAPIFQRVREYTSATPRPYYQHGVCGSSEAASSSSELPFLALGRFAYFAAAGGALCGDSLLGQGEQCDDGNTAGGDGCDSACRLEKSGKWWDCDLIGRPCLPRCGWSLTQQTQWGVGLAPSYVLPSSAANDCRGVSYFDFMQVPLPDQGGWLEANLVSCLCASNPMRAVPYEECTAENKGCRQCPPGQYHDDLRSKCTPCGAVCALGFQSGASSSCSNLVSTRDLGPPPQNRQELERYQSFIGCVPCPIPAVNDYTQLVFVVGGKTACDFTCAAPAYFCSTTGGGACAGACYSCQSSLESAKVSLRNTMGSYIAACVDGVGHKVLPCAAARLPTNAYFSGNSDEGAIGDYNGCPYSCNSNTQGIDGVCVPCVGGLGPSSCKPGERIYDCAGSTPTNIRRYCYPCSRGMGAPPPLEMWYSSTSFSTCYSDCESGLSFSPERGQACALCTQPQCSLGQLYSPCVPRVDAACSPCPNALLPNQEFAVAGSCLVRCKAGFALSALDASTCVPCAAVADRCSPYEAPAHNCSAPADRLRLPLCVRCPTQPMVGAARVSAATCELYCLPGFYYYNASTCLECPACPLGTKPACDGGPLKKCAQCPVRPPANASFIFADDAPCAYQCDAGFIAVGYPPVCARVAVDDNDGSPAQPPPPQPPPPPQEYPRRRLPHS